MFFRSQFPERVYTCKEGVTAADFSRHNPSLLAVNIKFNLITYLKSPMVNLSPYTRVVPVNRGLNFVIT